MHGNDTDGNEATSSYIGKAIFQPLLHECGKIQVATQRPRTEYDYWFTLAPSNTTKDYINSLGPEK